MSADRYTLKRICMNCFNEKGDVHTCPYCGYTDDENQMGLHLPLRAIIAGRYAVGRFLGANGDGATYLGYDVRSESPIIIREYLPANLITRGEDYAVKPQLRNAENYELCKEEFLEILSSSITRPDSNELNYRKERCSNPFYKNFENEDEDS